MDRSVQDRRADDMQLRLFRPVDRSGAAGQRGISRRQKIGMGLQAPEGEELSRSRAIHPAPLSRRLEDIGREHGQDALTRNDVVEDGERGRLDRSRRRLADELFPFALAHRTVRGSLSYKLFGETPNRATGTVALPVRLHASG